MSTSTPAMDMRFIRERLHALGFGTGTRDGELIVIVGDLTYWFRMDGPGSRLTVTTAHPRVLRGRTETLAGEMLATALNTIPGPGEVSFLPDVGILAVTFDLPVREPVTAVELDEFIMETLSIGVVVAERISAELQPLIRRVGDLTGA
ncbi:hypothetical protein JIM95_005985 [Corynebacterium sp. CCM 8835]|uniref:YbjN domain-containing protein n=1 Tax=Corynebacterium antarcticum TaxID=2800405 RepID=A0ABS1FND5_9CORY|nr:hypothetical protein [Corynebacterium antarcticum]MCK7660941.1 hypothetical protein [Corynebacterium antarcticum]MCL0245688.1 hypothetical protein [Corynebacterium antarcticum]MCX7540262.1 hypothetical protein [Corynebacterium antarcticum]